MAHQLKQLKGLDGSTVDVSKYNENDTGRFGKALDQKLHELLPDMYNFGPGVDLPELNLEVKSFQRDRSTRSYTTLIKITEKEIGLTFDQLSDHAQQKLMADRLFVCMQQSFVEYHKVIRYNKEQKLLFQQRFDLLSKKLRKSMATSMTYDGFTLERKANYVVEFRINNKRLTQINSVTHTTFNNLFED